MKQSSESLTKDAYLFDMDGVLVDNCRYHVLAWLELARRTGGRLTERQVIDWMGAPGRDYVVRMFDVSPSADRVAALLAEKEALYREMYRPHLKARDGLVEFLLAARAAGRACAIVTGGTADNVDFVVDGLGIRGFFAAVVDSSQCAHGKPAPDGYLKAAERLGVAPAGCLVFEDALNGLAAARAAGMEAVALVGTNPRAVLEAARPARVIDSFRELLPA